MQQKRSVRHHLRISGIMLPLAVWIRSQATRCIIIWEIGSHISQVVRGASVERPTLASAILYHIRPERRRSRAEEPEEPAYLATLCGSPSLT